MVNNFKIYKNFNLSKKDKGAIILIGNFDGLHRGHQKLFNRAKSFKKKFKLKIGVITFDPIPKMFFKGLNNYRLLNFDQKIQLLKKNSVDFIVNQKFNIRFSKISCLDFINKILFNKIKPKFIFVSDNFRFGYKRAGDIKLLKSLEKDYDYKIINPSPLKSKKFVISSTLIRKNLETGNLKKVKKFLGTAWNSEIIQEKIKNKKFKYWIYEVENSIKGYLGIQFLEEEIEILGIGVNQGSRRKNIATELMDELIEYFEKSEYKKIILEVRESNTVAQRLYKKYGFKQISRRKKYYVDEDAKVYQREKIYA